MKHIITTLLFVAFAITVPCAQAQGFDHTHSAFTAVLKNHVENDRVNYASLKKHQKPLNDYLDTLAAVSERSYRGWEKNQRMAFLINLYNAATLKLVTDHYPVKSIKKIGGMFKSPWKMEVVRLFGEKQSLDYIEHGVLRKKFNDARVHFAVNCASGGCPVLRAEAFQAHVLSKQLDEQGRIFLADRSKNRVDSQNKTLYLSKIFDWFKGDFEKQSGSVESFVSDYLSPVEAERIKRGGYSIRYLDYDWDLNKQ